ncbi:MAG: YfiR family protein [candidate division Zixibacteria bacterium]|nr:YfiR family protein [candidate division Zixibacteria bacterium]
MKAVFLYQFVKFVKWPPTEFPSPNTPIDIGVLGESPVFKYLAETVAEQKGNDRKLTVRSFRDADRAACQVLYIDAALKNDMPRILETFAGKPVLLVSDIDGFARQGGTIQFVNTGGKIKFIINHSAAQKAGLSISARLLALAQSVL